MTRTTLAITPAFNEEKSIAAVVEGVHRLGLPSVVINDGSTDATADLARQAGALVLNLPGNYGVGAALRTGFRFAVGRGFERVVQVDGDLQHDSSAIPQLLAAADDGAQLVIGSRFGADYEIGSRRVAIRLLSRVVTRQTGVEIEDPTSGFKVVSEPLLSEFAASYPAEYLGDTVEALLRASSLGATIRQIRVPMSKRVEGRATPTPQAAAHFGRVLLSIAAGKPQRRLK